VRPAATRRESNLPEHNSPAGEMITRNPGVSLLWTSKAYKPVRAENGVLFDVGDPHEVSWWREGRAATRAEIMNSIESGYPLLHSAAEKDGPRAISMLESMRETAMQLLPAA